MIPLKNNILLILLEFLDDKPLGTMLEKTTRVQVNEHTFTTWLSPVFCENLSEDQIILSAPNNFFVVWIRDHYLNLISGPLFQLTGRELRIEFIIRDEPTTQEPIDASKDTTEPPEIIFRER